MSAPAPPLCPVPGCGQPATMWTRLTPSVGIRTCSAACLALLPHFATGAVTATAVLAARARQRVPSRA